MSEISEFRGSADMAAGDESSMNEEGFGHLVVDRLAVSFGTGSQARSVLGDVSFSVARKGYVSIVGPSGTGKSTVLRCIAGLHSPSQGDVSIQGESVRDGSASQLAIVFQDYSRSLLPWLSITSNVTLPLLGKGIPRAERLARAEDALDAVGLVHVGRQYPWQLSGGMQQRVAIARALAYQPAVLLMDEPFASVDAQTRADLEDLVLRIHRRSDMTVVSVTHDIDEAVYMSDRVIVLGGNPASVVDDVRIGLGRERDQIETRSSERFAEIRAHVLRKVRGQSL